jgi:hypothetical protein
MPTCEERNRDFAERCDKEAKRAAKLTKKPTTPATLHAAEVLAQMDKEERDDVKAAHKAALKAPPLRRIAQTHILAILPARNHRTEVERKAARAASQAKYQAKVNRNPEAKAACRDTERARQRVWVAAKRAEARKPRLAQLAADHCALYTFWLSHWVLALISGGCSLPRRRDIALKSYCGCLLDVIS